MKRFHETVDILVKAYLDDTLFSGFCEACAVGNIIAARMGNEIEKTYYSNNRLVFKQWDKTTKEFVGMLWGGVFITIYKKKNKLIQRIHAYNYKDKTKEQIDSTQYTWQELARVEYAFEASVSRYSKDSNSNEAMFKRLMAVVDVLADIDGIDLNTTEKAKSLFIKV